MENNFQKISGIGSKSVKALENYIDSSVEEVLDVQDPSEYLESFTKRELVEDVGLHYSVAGKLNKKLDLASDSIKTREEEYTIKNKETKDEFSERLGQELLDKKDYKRIKEFDQLVDIPYIGSYGAKRALQIAGYEGVFSPDETHPIIEDQEDTAENYIQQWEENSSIGEEELYNLTEYFTDKGLINEDTLKSENKTTEQEEIEGAEIKQFLNGVPLKNWMEKTSNGLESLPERVDTYELKKKGKEYLRKADEFFWFRFPGFFKLVPPIYREYKTRKKQERSLRDRRESNYNTFEVFDAFKKHLPSQLTSNKRHNPVSKATQKIKSGFDKLWGPNIDPDSTFGKIDRTIEYPFKKGCSLISRITPGKSRAERRKKWHEQAEKKREERVNSELKEIE